MNDPVPDLLRDTLQRVFGPMPLDVRRRLFEAAGAAVRGRSCLEAIEIALIKAKAPHDDVMLAAFWVRDKARAILKRKEGGDDREAGES